MIGSAPDTAADFTIEQNWRGYSEAEHAIWRLLFERQQKLLVGRACEEYLDGLGALGVAAGGIPDFRRLSDALERATGWRIIAVPGLVPDAVFFAHLARRRFPSTCFIRRRDQLDYLQEPDVFHDICGHVPLLMNPLFADYMQAYGEGGLRAVRLRAIQRLARLYWHTVEFGLIRSPEGLRIYGAGIVSSHGESVYALDDPKPPRVAFDRVSAWSIDSIARPPVCSFSRALGWPSRAYPRSSGTTRCSGATSPSPPATCRRAPCAAPSSKTVATGCGGPRAGLPRPARAKR